MNRVIVAAAVKVRAQQNSVNLTTCVMLGLRYTESLTSNANKHKLR